VGKFEDGTLEINRRREIKRERKNPFLLMLRYIKKKSTEKRSASHLCSC